LTNIEYYGSKNLKYLEFFATTKGTYGCDIYYHMKHADFNVLLKTFYGTKEEIRNEKAKWLISEAKPTNLPFNWPISEYIFIDIGGQSVFYRMKHAKKLEV